MNIAMKLPDNDKYFVFGGLPLLVNRMQSVGDTITRTITLKQWTVLLVVRDMPEGSSITDIAQQHGSSRQNVKKLLDRLSKLGYIEFRSAPGDKRSHAVHMTQKGIEDMVRISEVGGAFVERIFTGITSDDIAATGRTIAQLIENLDEMMQDTRLIRERGL